jgi:hypothetical protein
VRLTSRRTQASQKIEDAIKYKGVGADQLEAFKATLEKEFDADKAKSEASADQSIKSWRSVVPDARSFGRVFHRWIKEHEQIDILLQAAEERFNASLDQIDHHVHSLGRKLREDLGSVIEGEIIEPEAASGRGAGATGSQTFGAKPLARRDRIHAERPSASSPKPPGDSRSSANPRRSARPRL